MSTRVPTRVSRSLLATVVALLALSALGVAKSWPRWTSPNPHAARVDPVLLRADADVRGWVDLGDGARASIYASGLRIEQGDQVVLKTIERAAPLSALTGRLRTVDGRPSEDVSRRSEQVRITGRALSAGAVTYTGSVRLTGGRELPLTLAVRRVSDGIDVDATVSGADAVVLGLDERFVHVVAPSRAALRVGAWWPAASRVYLRDPKDGPSWAMTVRTQRPTRFVVDQRQRGLTEMHVWSASVSLELRRTTVDL